MHLEHERGGVGCDLGGKGEGVLDVLLGEDGHACGNPAYQGKRYRTAVRRLLDLCKAYGTTVLIEQLERTGLRGVAFDDAALRGRSGAHGPWRGRRAPRRPPSRARSADNPSLAGTHECSRIFAAGASKSCVPSMLPPYKTFVRFLLDRNNCSKIMIYEHSFLRQSFLSGRRDITVSSNEKGVSNARYIRHRRGKPRAVFRCPL